MKNLLRILIGMFITAAVIFAVHFVLTLESVDLWLSSKFAEKKEIQSSIIYREEAGKKFDINENEHPCIYAKKDRLYMAIGNKTADITPESINISYYGSFVDFNEIINRKENCIVTEDGRYIVYRLLFNDIPYLYYYDRESEKFFFIAERVDSFDVIENDGSGALTLIYAAGYAQSNSLNIFVSDESGETSGKSSVISTDNKSAGVFESYGAVVYISNSGELSKYDVRSKESVRISDKTEKIYFPGDKEYNYDKYYKEFTVCAVKEGRDVILNSVSEAEISGGYYNIIPQYTFKRDSDENVLYYYSVCNMRIMCVSDGKEFALYDDLGDIYRVFSYGNGHFIAANRNFIYKLNDDGSKAVQIFKLPYMYRGRFQMLQKHMDIIESSENVFYVNMLTSGSLVFNRNNMNSWMNNISSYNYGLTVIKAAGDSFESEDIPVSSSRVMSMPLEIGGENGCRIYVSYYPDGNVKSVSVLSEDGRLKYKDILNSSYYAEGQCRIDLFLCNSGLYLLKQESDKKAEFYYMDNLADSMEVVADEKGVFTEIYQEIKGAVSFGKLVIF